MSFEQQVRQFADDAIENVDKVYRYSLRDVMQRATQEQPSVSETGGSFEIGKVPVLTRELADSFFVSINGGVKPNALGKYRRLMDKVKITDAVSFGWSAPHAQKMEYGDGTVAGRFFATTAASAWTAIVRRNANLVGR